MLDFLGVSKMDDIDDIDHIDWDNFEYPEDDDTDTDSI